MSKESKRSAREALQAERARQAAADKRRQRIINTAIIIVVVLVVGGIFIAVQKNRSTGTTTGALPQGVTENGGPLVFGSGPVKVDVYEDFQCPNCKDFEAVNGKYLKQQVDSKAITLLIHPVTFLNQNLGNTSSTLAANAFACSYPTGQSQALAFHTLIYQNQPPETNPGYTQQQMIDWAKQAGVTGSTYESCVKDGTYNTWTDQVTATMATNGVTGTPTIFINGKKQSTLNWTDPKALPAAITAAQQG